MRRALPYHREGGIVNGDGGQATAKGRSEVLNMESQIRSGPPFYCGASQKTSLLAAMVARLIPVSPSGPTAESVAVATQQ